MLAPCAQQTLLHRAANRGHARACASLLAQGAEVDALDGFGMTPLGDVLMTWSLLQHRGIELGHPDYYETMEQRLVDTLVVLLEHGASIKRALQSEHHFPGSTTEAWLERQLGMYHARKQQIALETATPQASGQRTGLRL